MQAKLQVLEQTIATTSREGIESICITDIARFKHAHRTAVIIGNSLEQNADRRRSLSADHL